MKKRILSLLIALLMVLTLVPMTALAYKSDTDIAYAVTGGNLYFDKSTGTITDCDETVTVADIPSAIEAVAVTSIGSGAFTGCTSLKSINVAAANMTYSSVDGVLFNKDKTELII